jgi:serine/threonine protein kinase
MPPDEEKATLLRDTNPRTSHSTIPAAEAMRGVKVGGRYVIERELGRGGMGAVYLARDKPELHSRPVVVKLLHEEALKHDWVVAKFRQEIESLTRLDDPGVVGIFDAGMLDDGTPYLVMQYVEGTNLRAAMKPEGMDLVAAAEIIRQIGRSVAAAHEAGILHRDLKPENIMLRTKQSGEQQVKIIDFGIAKVKDSLSGPSPLTGMTVGTIAYMSPEQLSAKPLTVASDIYSIGVIAYEMLTGRKPFTPDSMFQLLEMQRAGVRIKPCDLRPSLPEAAQQVMLKALTFDPKDRYQNARKFSEELAAALTSGYEVGERTTQDRSADRTRRSESDLPKTVAAQPTQEGATQPAKPMLETAHVLFMDIVSYSSLLIDEQTERLQELQNIVRNTQEFQRAELAGQLLRLPTGDGMALSFFGDPEAPGRCAVEISRALSTHPELKLRMGVHSGLVYRVADINENLNISGGGINVAQRVMDCGDAGHILLSKRVADDIGQLARWAKSLHDLGEAVVKHGQHVHIYNLYNDEIGNPEAPAKLRIRKPMLSNLTRAPVAAWLGIAVLLVALAVFWFIKLRPRVADSTGSSATVAPANAAVERTFSYSMRVQKYRNGKPYKQPFIIPGEINFEPDDRIQVLFASPQDGYLYLVNRGPDDRASSMILYPDGSKSALIAAKQQVQVPAPSKNPEEDWIGFDKEEGPERLWFVWSLKPIPILEDVKKWSNPKDLGEIKDANQDQQVREFLASKEGSLPEGKRNQDGTRTTVGGSSDVVVFRIYLQHH